MATIPQSDAVSFMTQELMPVKEISSDEKFEKIKNECLYEIQNWKNRAQKTKIIEPLFVPEKTILRDDEQFIEIIRKGILDRLKPVVNKYV